MGNVAEYAICIAVSAALTALGLYEDDTVVTTYSAICLALLSILCYSCRGGTIDWRIPSFVTAMLFTASMIFLYVLNFDGELVGPGSYIDADGDIVGEFSATKKIYAHVEGAVAWAIAYPLGFLATVDIALLFRSKLNRYLVGGFLAFNSEAFTSLMLIVLSVFNKEHLGVDFFFIDELAYLFVGLVLSAIFGALTAICLKGRDFQISPEHLVRRG